MQIEHTVLLLTGISWGGDYLRSTVELARELARKHRVLFVESPAVLGKVGPAAAQCWQPDPDLALHVLRPAPVPPTQRLPPGPLWRTAARFVRRSVAHGIDRALDTLGWQADVAVHAWNPALTAGWVGRFGQRADVYYTYDDLWACPWKARHGRAEEQVLASSCDAVVATAPVLVDRYRSMNPFTVLLPNGVDFAAFQAPQRPPPGVRDDSRPVVGYVGSIDSRVDLGLLRALAEAHPEWHLLVAGPVRGVDASRLDGVPNLTRIGSVTRRELPGLVQHFDVGLVPFVHSAFTRALCPLKIYDYLAAGIGVAATAFAPLDEVRPVVSIGDGVAGLSAAIRRELEAPEARRLARREVARAASWSARAASLDNVLNGVLNAKEREAWQLCW